MIVGRARNFTKKFIWLRKFIDFVPYLSITDRACHVYSRVKAEEQKVTSYLSVHPRPKVNLVCDLRSIPPTYGDFSAFLMAIRILSTKFRVTFIMVVGEFRADWALLGKDDQITRVAHFKEMAERVVSASDSQLLVTESFEKISELTVDSQIVFAEYVHRRKGIYWVLKLLNDVLFNHLGCTEDVLLDRVQFLDPKIQITKPYVLWHIRRNSIWETEFDLSDQDIVNLYQKLREVIGINVNIVVCSSNEGLRGICELASKSNLEITPSRHYSANFLGDVALLYGSLFFIQLGGGGMSEYAWSSSVPFLDINSPFPNIHVIYKRLFGVKVKSGSATSWRCSKQILSTTARYKRLDIDSQLLLVYEEHSFVN